MRGKGEIAGMPPISATFGGGEVSLLYCRSQYSFAMLASKSLMLAKTLLNKPASLQFAVQRFMSAAPDMKVQPKETKPVVVRSACDA